MPDYIVLSVLVLAVSLASFAFAKRARIAKAILAACCPGCGCCCAEGGCRGGGRC
jgi:hypothetical protein